MTWHAIDVLDDAFDATKRLLLPPRPRTLLALALVVFFTSGVSGFSPNLNFNVGFSEGDFGGMLPPFRVDPSAFVGGLVALAVLALVFLYVGAVMEFVLVRALSTRSVRVRRYFGESSRFGRSLFLFRVVVGLVVLSTALLFVGLSEFSGPLALVALVSLLPVVAVLGVALWLLLRLTTDFVVPTMLVERTGVVGGWRAFWPALVDDWQQYGVYLLVRLLLGLVAGVVVAVGFVFVALVVGIPFAVVGLVLVLLADFAAGAGAIEIVAAVLLALYLLCVVVAGTTLAQVPVQTYLRYYSLFALAETTPAYDLVSGSSVPVTDAGDDERVRDEGRVDDERVDHDEDGSDRRPGPDR